MSHLRRSWLLLGGVVILRNATAGAVRGCHATRIQDRGRSGRFRRSTSSDIGMA